jgi:hypothetical protein
VLGTTLTGHQPIGSGNVTPRREEDRARLMRSSARKINAHDALVRAGCGTTEDPHDKDQP